MAARSPRLPSLRKQATRGRASRGLRGTRRHREMWRRDRSAAHGAAPEREGQRWHRLGAAGHRTLAPHPRPAELGPARSGGRRRPRSALGGPDVRVAFTESHHRADVRPAAVIKPPPVTRAHLARKKPLSPGHTAPLAPGRGALRTNNRKAECGGQETWATPVRLSGRGRQPRQKHQRDAQRRFAGAGSCQGRHARDAEGAEHRRPGEGTETSTPCPGHRGPRNRKAAASEIRQGGERPGGGDLFSPRFRCRQKLCARKA